MPSIHNLADVPEHVETVAGWQNSEWGAIRGESIDHTLSVLKRNMSKDAWPFVLLALQDSVAVGTASLIADDMPTRPEFSPWLADVYVAKDRRKDGVGRLLVDAVEREAVRLGVTRIYLFTASNTALYERMGWLLVERTDYRGEPVRIMTKELS